MRYGDDPKAFPSQDPHWYALSVRSRYEKRANGDLLSRGIESFLPLVQELHIWSDRKKKVLTPLFRGYVFVRTDMRNRLNILQVGGVTRFVQFSNKPAAIPEKQIESIRIVLGQPSTVERESYLSRGDKVRVTSGPFEGIEGMVRHSRGAMRVVISLDAIAESVSVEIPPSFLVRCDDNQGLAQAN
jgi:transcription antitermination factor NusG